MLVTAKALCVLIKPSEMHLLHLVPEGIKPVPVSPDSNHKYHCQQRKNDFKSCPNWTSDLLNRNKFIMIVYFGAQTLCSQ